MSSGHLTASNGSANSNRYMQLTEEWHLQQNAQNDGPLMEESTRRARELQKKHDLSVHPREGDSCVVTKEEGVPTMFQGEDKLC
jgi:hypothetical protein